jgi:sugar (pentulose or hexulose) kinase
VVEWASRLLNLTDNKQAFQDCMNNVQKLADKDYQNSSSSSKTTSTNLTMIPFLSGERATGFRGGATGSIVGLTRAITPAHFLKSCLEGVTLRLRAVLQLLLQARNGGESSDLPLVVVSGKALEANDLWRQMIADSCGLKVVLDSETFEGTSRGVARLVAVALAAQSDRATSATSGNSKFLLEEELCAATTNYPRPNAKAYFDGAAATQEEFICAMSPLYNRSKDG